MLNKKIKHFITYVCVNITNIMNFKMSALTVQNLILPHQGHRDGSQVLQSGFGQKLLQ